jgi:hypothetical protein
MSQPLLHDEDLLGLRQMHSSKFAMTKCMELDAPYLGRIHDSSTCWHDPVQLEHILFPAFRKIQPKLLKGKSD